MEDFPPFAVLEDRYQLNAKSKGWLRYVILRWLFKDSTKVRVERVKE